MNAPAEMIPLQISVQHPSAQALARHGASALDLVQSFEIVDDATYEIAADELKAIQKRETQLDEQRKAITKPMDEAKKAVMDLFRVPVETLGKAAGILKSKMLTYQQEQQRKANEARIAAERAAQEERDRLQAEAAKLAAEGKAGEAAVKETVAQMVVSAPVSVSAPQKVSGVKTTTSVDFEVVDTLALIKHIAQNHDLVALLTVDSVKLRAYVKGIGMACKLPGVRVFEKQGISASRK